VESWLLVDYYGSVVVVIGSEKWKCWKVEVEEEGGQDRDEEVGN
jgi:hypothetical protein